MRKLAIVVVSLLIVVLVIGAVRCGGGEPMSPSSRTSVCCSLGSSVVTFFLLTWRSFGFGGFGGCGLLLC